MLTQTAFGAIARAGVESEGPVVVITKDAHAEGRKCEIRNVVLHTNSYPHGNEVAHKLIIELRKPRGSYLECPTSVAMNLDTRAEVMKLYELVRGAKKVVCQSSSVIGAAQLSLTCDGAFEVRSEI